MRVVAEERGAEATFALRAAYRLGESAAAADLTIEETFALLEQEAGEALTDLSAVILGSIVRGYVDQVVRTRGATRRRSAGRLSSHVARLAALHRINRVATGSLDLERMLSTVVDVVADTVQSDACSVFLYDPDSEMLVLRATKGLNPDAVGRVTIRAFAGITGLAASTRETQVALDAQSHPAFFTYPIVGEDPYVSQVSVPLLLREPERLVGVMNIQTLQRHDFDPDEVTFFETAAGELAIAIENARLYSQTDAALHQRINELRVLQSVTRSIASTLQPDTLLPMIASQALQLIGGTSATIFRLRMADQPAGLQVLATVSLAGGDDSSSLSADEAIVADVCRTQSVMVRPAGDSISGTLLFCAPLLTVHGIRGAICVRAPAPHDNVDDRLGLFQAFADSAALALENADLYDEARQGYATASTLLQEMHHRVRNNLQTVAALLSMQARHAQYAEWTQPLQQAVARVQSIAAVHNLLSADNLTSTTVSAIAKHVADEATINVVPPGLDVCFAIDPSAVEVTSRQATILALLINECLTNAIEHGMAGREQGTISIASSGDDGSIEVIVADDGNGLPDGFRVEEHSSLGLRIARTLAVSDLRGSFDLLPRDGGGTRAVIRFPKALER
jgi:two-component sensor histidine kinase/putative methionine-R-sulfoxide reductase with GAF domain